jgi:broad specificity phosphatase PhoE
MSSRVTLISHGATAAVRRAAFPLNEALEEREVARLQGAGWVVPRAQHMLTGPEQRTRETAGALGLDATECAELRDAGFAEWAGSTLGEIEERDPAGLYAWLTDTSVAPHGGESIAAVWGRTKTWIEGLVGNGYTLAVTHPAVIRCAVLVALEAPLSSFWRVEIAPGTVTDLRFNGRSWMVRSLGVKLGDAEVEEA